MVQHDLHGRGLALTVVYIVMPLVAMIVFALRVYVRFKVKLSYEDWIAGVGCLLFTVYGGCAASGPFYGMGKHTYLISYSDQSTALKARMIQYYCVYTDI